MITLQTPTITVSNMAEVLYLLDRSNRIISAGMVTTMEGTRVFSVTLAGEGVEEDHSRYLSYCPCQSTRLGVAFEAIEKAIAEKSARCASGVEL